MFASRAVTSTPSGHRFTSSAKFKSTREITNERDDRRRISEFEDEKHPSKSVACASISSLFCPILGLIAFFYAMRALHAYRQGYYAEATVFYKKSIQWSLITFVLGLVIGSTVTLFFFVRSFVSV